MKTPRIQNVFVYCGGDNYISIYWHHNGEQYHLNLENEGRLYKNPIPEQRDGEDYYLRSGDPGYFPTRSLNPLAARNAAMIAEAKLIVETRDLIKHAKTCYRLNEEREAAELNNRIARCERGRELFDTMRAYTNNDPALGGLSMSIGRDDMLALLEFAPRPNGE